MQYRKFGKIDWMASALGFGCMRLPTPDGQRASPNVDEAESIRMVHRAIERGINYFDTAWPYHQGRSELVLGQALKGGHRQKVRVADKLPVWLVNAPGDFDRLLDEQLKRLQTDHIDFYLLHALNAERWKTVREHDVLGRAARALADGRIGHLGFSFHDEYDSFAEILGGSDLWSFCQIQYNYMDVETQAGTRGLELAASKGLAVVIMEPLLGGRLVAPPPAIRRRMDGSPVKRSPVGWALDWLWDRPEISVVLSGMSSMDQLEENLALADASRPRCLGPVEHALIGEVREMYRARTPIPCTKCGYCMPCPNGVDIPGNFDLFNFAHLYEDVADARFRYGWRVKPEARASACGECMLCEEQCPQKIQISQWMPKVAELLC